MPKAKLKSDRNSNQGALTAKIEAPGNTLQLKTVHSHWEKNEDVDESFVLQTEWEETLISQKNLIKRVCTIKKHW